jgi:simple sugar transport system ATP-binding protein
MVSGAATREADEGGVAPALRFNHISKAFGGVKALDDVSFEVMPGEVHCIAGENGSGKSTLIKVITGVYTPDPGAEMEYFSERVESVSPGMARRFGIDVIWQDLALFPQMTVAENIAFQEIVGGRPRLVNRRALRVKARRELARLGVDLDLEARLSSLSIAERQIAAICRALVGEARLIFMDEPTSSLTHTETESLFAVVRKLSADGVAVVFVSHRLAEVLKISSRVTVLRDGRRVGVFDTATITQSRLTELMTGKTFDNVVIARDRTAAPAVLEVRGLTRASEFSDIDLTIRAGEVVGLTGLIGAGRTELGLTLFGITHPDRGEVRLNGKLVRFHSNRDAIAAGVAYVSEDRLTLGLVQPQPIADNIVLPVLNRILDAVGLISGRKKAAMVANWIQELVIKVGRPEDAISTLSGGNQQRVVLAKWLATEPKLLILDSPTVGVDVGARAGIFAIVRHLAEQGLAILLISDEVPEVYFNADRIVHMVDGRFVATYHPEQMALADVEKAVYA